MRKFWIGVALASLMIASASVGAWAATGTRKNIEVEYQNIKIAVNGSVIDVGNDEPFLYVEKERTYVPARYVAEALGAKVGWNQATSTVEISTPDYVKVTTDGEYKVWAMPGQGFTLRAPRGFMRQDIGTALLQLALPDPATGANAVVAVAKTEVPGAGYTLKQQMDDLMSGLSATFLPDAKVTNTVSAADRVTVEGTTSLFGKVPASFTLRLIAGEKNNWLLMSLTPGSLQTQLTPVMKEILESFTLTN